MIGLRVVEARGRHVRGSEGDLRVCQACIIGPSECNERSAPNHIIRTASFSKAVASPFKGRGCLLGPATLEQQPAQSHGDCPRRVMVSPSAERRHGLAQGSFAGRMETSFTQADPATHRQPGIALIGAEDFVRCHGHNRGSFGAWLLEWLISSAVRVDEFTNEA